VTDYISAFEAITMHIDDASQGELIHKFIHGLKHNIRTNVLLQNPSSLNGAMQLAMSAEDIR
jgi:hypothetical protein